MQTDEAGRSLVETGLRSGRVTGHRHSGFAFLGENDDECKLRLKLRESIPDLDHRAAADAERWQVGTGGWVLVTFPPSAAPKVADLRRWITESFRLLAPKKVVAQFDA